MNNCAMANFFGKLQVERFCGEQFDSVDEFIHALDNQIYYYSTNKYF